VNEVNSVDTVFIGLCICLSVSAQQTGQSELNANSSKTATAITNIKFDAHVSRYCPDVFP